jgi:hypothetical protein
MLLLGLPVFVLEGYITVSSSAVHSLTGAADSVCPITLVVNALQFVGVAVSFVTVSLSQVS